MKIHPHFAIGIFTTFLLLFSCISKRNTIKYKETTQNTKTSIKILNIPNGYNPKDIRYVKGHNTLLLIPYRDSATLYVTNDIEHYPNRKNIEQIRSIASVWRNNYRFRLLFKKKNYLPY